MKDVQCRDCDNLKKGWCPLVSDSPDPDVYRDCVHFRDEIMWGVTRAQVRTWAEAYREGRLTIEPQAVGIVCGTCGHFCRTPGKRSGGCAVRPWQRNRYGIEEPSRGRFSTYQKRPGCKDYIRKEAKP